jgi:hypothetical protein
MGHYRAAQLTGGKQPCKNFLLAPKLRAAITALCAPMLLRWAPSLPPCDGLDLCQPLAYGENATKASHFIPMMTAFQPYLGQLNQ